MLIKGLQFSNPGRAFRYIIAILAGCAVLAIPLIGTLHIDSALLAGVVVAIAGAWVASRQGVRNREVLMLVGLVYIAAVPLLIRDLLTGCFSSDGVAFWMFIPSFSAFFGFAFGRMVRYCLPAYARLAAFVGIAIITVGGWLAVFFLFPQLFYFNHVFGYWPGPIYDESVAFTDRILHYRFITATWIGIFWMIPHLKGSDRIIKAIFLLLILLLGLGYAQSSQRGIFSSASHIQNELGGLHQTDHFDIYFSEKHYDDREIAFIGVLHEFHFYELTDTLHIDWPEGKRIKSYLYGHAWQMQELTGAKGVSFVPVWLKSAQIHIHKTALDRTLRHELVHVIARSFGNRLLNASWNIGLVEGLAVALSPASSARLTSDQLVVSNNVRLSEMEVRRLFSLTGFYRQSGSVAYGVSGSFVRSLLSNYPVEHFKTAYRLSSLERGYGDLLIPAINYWHDELALVQVTDEERETAERIFSIPSIFDTKCPRKITERQACLDAAARTRAHSDTTGIFGQPDRDHLRTWLQELLGDPIDRCRFEEYRNAVYLLAFDYSGSRNLFDYSGLQTGHASTDTPRIDKSEPDTTARYARTYNLKICNSPAGNLAGLLYGIEWRPIQQKRLDEAYRFARFVNEWEKAQETFSRSVSREGS